MPDTTTLTIVRRAAHPNRLRAYRVVLDGNEIGTVKNGEAFSTAVPPGDHTLVVKVDWVRSSPLRLSCVESIPTFVRCDTSSDPLEILKAVLGRASTHLALTMQGDDSLTQTPQELASHRVSVATRAKRAAIWFVSTSAVGLGLSLLLESEAVSPDVVARRQNVIGQLTGMVAVLGAMWWFLRKPKSR